MIRAGKLHMFMWTGEHIPVRVVNVTWTDLSSFACMRHLWSQVWSALRWVWSFWEAMTESLYVARIAVSSAKVAVVVAGEVGRSAVYMRFRNGPRTLPYGTPAWIVGRGCWAEPNLTKKYLFCRKHWRRSK
jgi:hypothetical protein